VLTLDLLQQSQEGLVRGKDDESEAKPAKL
jgi:hypothetical protein